MREFIIYGWEIVIWYDKKIKLWTATADKDGHDQIVEYHANRDILCILIGGYIVKKD